MLKRKVSLKIIASLVLIALTFLINVTVFVSAEERELYLGGFPAGFVLSTTTVQVVGVCDVLTKDGMQSPARDCGIKTGDIIKKINDVDVTNVEKVNKAVSDEYKEFLITLIRENKEFQVKTNAVIELSSGKKRLGLMIKDNLNGIGTVTFIDKNGGKFGALGHPVTDEKNLLQNINGGVVYTCRIYEVKRGVRGTPGELRGIFENNNIIGNAELNCNSGVFGKIANDINYDKLTKIKSSNIDGAKMGAAKVYSTVDGKGIDEYNVSIVKIDKENKDNKNFVIKIEDENLIKKTGGIVQGMSGSPIVQNGKLIGAITHVFINDPTRGYGIAIDKMLSSY
ncbi:MAG: SpoIVB peptidase [Clostridia bacterium]|nr:SpoIVB peptidase [Clostridia bacterium]